MSELKEWTADEIDEYDDARLELAEDGKIDCTRVYIKADADEVISTIKAERDEYRYNLSCARNEIYNMQISMREDIKKIAEKDEELRHQKYKRSLDKANYWVAIGYHCVDDKHRQRAERHHRKWLELANKFNDKEAK